MSTKTLIPVEEYLRTSFEDGDCEYVDGEVVERNVGEGQHSWIQSWLHILLREQAKRYGAKVRVELRVRTRETRFRVPDIGVWRSTDDISSGYGKVPPFLAVEVLSPDDRMSRVNVKIREYLEWGVQWVWIIDPVEGIALTYSPNNPLGDSVTVLRTDDPLIEIPLDVALNPQD